MLVSDAQLQKEAERSASYVFTCSSIGETNNRCGILIYLALFEHKFVILPDESCREILGDDEIKTICDGAVERLAKREFATAFLEVMERVSKPLADKLPADRQLNENELADHLLIFHPSVI